jgi:hypothetical protein
MVQFVNQIGFKLLTSTPYYAQANGQVEAANKVIITLIKKHVSDKPRNWHKILDQALWAYVETLPENRPILIISNSHLDMMQCYLSKSGFNQPESEGN